MRGFVLKLTRVFRILLSLTTGNIVNLINKWPRARSERKKNRNNRGPYNSSCQNNVAWDELCGCAPTPKSMCCRVNLDNVEPTTRADRHSINVANSILCFRAHLLLALSWRIPIYCHLLLDPAPCTWVDRVSRVITGYYRRVLITLSAILSNSIRTKEERSRLLFQNNPFNYH